LGRRCCGASPFSTQKIPKVSFSEIGSWKRGAQSE
jgi:hypothetical protein